jgi:hypothetical protein
VQLSAAGSSSSNSLPRDFRQASRSNARGATPNRCRNDREKSDGDVKPQSRAISVRDRFREKAISCSAFSSRRRFTKSAGVSPTSD